MSTAVLHNGFAAASRQHAEPRQPRLRLTRRGRSVLTVLGAVPLVIAAFAVILNGGGATASLEGSDVPFEYVTVEAGQSLWQVAVEVAPTADPRDVIHAIMKLNGLTSSDVLAGEQLALPAQYTD